MMPSPSRPALLAITLLAATAAHAQPAPKTTVEEVVVTAEKRQSTVQRTPISITAISGKQLAERGITSVTQVATETPGLSIRSAGPGQTELEGRGLSSSGGSSPTVGFYLDETPLSPPAAAQNGKVVVDPDLFDLNRVEVLRGPQGTLYGSGSMGGTVKLITNPPNTDKFEGEVVGDLSGTSGGGFNRGGSAMLNVPVNDKIAARVSVTDKFRDGWINRYVLDDFPLETNNGCAAAPTFYGCTRGNVLGVPISKTIPNSNTDRLEGYRGAVLLHPTDPLTITISGLYQHIHQDGYDEIDSPPGAAAPGRYQPFDLKEPINDNFRLASLVAKYEFDWAELTAATSYWARGLKQTQDTSEEEQNLLGLNYFLPIRYSENDYSHQFSEEVRLSTTFDGPLHVVGGVFYSNLKSIWEELNHDPEFAFLSSPPGQNPDGVIFYSYNPYNISQVAVFGDVSYKLWNQVIATAGLRWFSYDTSVENYEAGYEATGNASATTQHVASSDSGLNPKFNIAWEPDPDTTVYATAAKGFRPGGVNISVPSFCFPANGLNSIGSSYGPDKVWNYEGGEKLRLFDDRVTLNADFFYIQWNGVQQVVNLPCGYVYTANAGNAYSYGPEAELTARITDNLTFYFAGNRVNAKIDQVFPDTGLIGKQQILNVPKYTGSFAVTYSQEVADRWRAFARAEDIYTGPSHDISFTYVNLPANNIVNLRCGVEHGPWLATAYITNVTNKLALLSANDTTFAFNTPSIVRYSTNQPRTIGVEVAYKF